MNEGYFVLTALYFPPLLAQRKFIELMLEDDAKHQTAAQASTDASPDTTPPWVFIPTNNYLPFA